MRKIPFFDFKPVIRFVSEAAAAAAAAAVVLKHGFDGNRKMSAYVCDVGKYERAAAAAAETRGNAELKRAVVLARGS